jgi:uncharacterized protein DUF1351
MENNLKLVVSRKIGPIVEFNLEELERKLELIAEEYRGLVVTEDTLPSCKKSQKELASLRIGIDDERKEINKFLKIPIDSMVIVRYCRP